MFRCKGKRTHKKQHNLANKEVDLTKKGNSVNPVRYCLHFAINKNLISSEIEHIYDVKFLALRYIRINTELVGFNKRPEPEVYNIVL